MPPQYLPSLGIQESIAKKSFSKIDRKNGFNSPGKKRSFASPVLAREFQLLFFGEATQRNFKA